VSLFLSVAKRYILTCRYTFPVFPILAILLTPDSCQAAQGVAIDQFPKIVIIVAVDFPTNKVTGGVYVRNSL